MRIEIPEIAVVALVGISGSGKSTFAAKHFKPTEILSSDYFRALVSDDENNMSVTGEAFESLYYIANKRLNLGLLTVIDATNVQKESRQGVLSLAREQNCHAVAVVFNLPEKLCVERNNSRIGRNLNESIIKRQAYQLRQSIKYLKKEGFRYVYVLNGDEEVAEAEIVRNPLWNNKKDERGPFDIIGDIHGCYDELCELLAKLGYEVDKENCEAYGTGGRRAVFLGDLCDRGNKNVQALKLVMNMTESGNAYCVPGNHDMKLLRKLKKEKVALSHGLDKTLEELKTQPPGFIEKVKTFINALISHYVFDGGKLVVAHAGLAEKYQGRGSVRVREFCLYGDTTGETDEYGLPVRLPWANEYRGKALVVYGHTPSNEVQIVNNTVCIDTGCVFGGKLTAYRYPEKKIVQVEAKEEYYRPVKPLKKETEEYDDMLNIEDVTGRRYISTKLKQNIKISEESSVAALEIMSRFAADPHWLIYLPPTMSPCETSGLDGYLEYPTEAFEYYKSRDVGKVVCEKKHMGSRAVIALCKDNETAEKIFSVRDGSAGIIYTRTGRHFFDGETTEGIILDRLRNVLTRTNFWEEFNTGWVCLDTELMPWSAKAMQLIESQYAGVGLAARETLDAAVNAVRAAAERIKGIIGEGSRSNQSIDLEELLEEYTEKKEAISLYTEAYRRYCWDVKSVDDYRVAPFHILATEDKVWSGENHMIHMETIKKYMTGIDDIFIATPYIVVDLLDEISMRGGIDWWESLTEAGGEGMVVKPFDFIAMKGGEPLQPAIKCRGKEYLRIIYGPEYTLGSHLDRLKKRSLSKKRNLASSEFALGMESLERFVKKEPLYRVHECVFGILALESEPVDPRL